MFAKVTLVRTPEGELLLVPEVRAVEEIEQWAGLADGRTVLKPVPKRVAVPGEKRRREPFVLSPVVDGAVRADTARLSLRTTAGTRAYPAVSGRQTASRDGNSHEKGEPR